MLILQPIYYIVFITQKLGATAENGLQIWNLHQKIHRIKNEKMLLFICIKA